MKVMGLEIPSKAVINANLAMKGKFRLEDVRGAFAAALWDEDFDYGNQHKDAVHDRGADRILQGAKRNGVIRHIGGGYWEYAS